MEIPKGQACQVCGWRPATRFQEGTSFLYTCGHDHGCQAIAEVVGQICTDDHPLSYYIRALGNTNLLDCSPYTSTGQALVGLAAIVHSVESYEGGDR